MYRVLVPVDRDVSRVLRQVNYVADLPHASESVEAVLLHVFSPEDSDGIHPDREPFESSRRVPAVRRADSLLQDRGVSVTLVDEGGETADTIFEAAANHDVDAIVLGGRKQSPAKKALFGSVTQCVILDATRPVVVTGTDGS